MQPVVQRSRERATTKQGLGDKVQGEDSVKHRDMTDVSVLEVKVSRETIKLESGCFMRSAVSAAAVLTEKMGDGARSQVQQQSPGGKLIEHCGLLRGYEVARVRGYEGTG